MDDINAFGAVVARGVPVSARLWMVKVEACVYVLAESEREAGHIAQYGIEKDWLDAWAYPAPVLPDEIDRDWRDVLPLVGFGEDEPVETCVQEWKAKHELTLPGVTL